MSPEDSEKFVNVYCVNDESDIKEPPKPVDIIQIEGWNGWTIMNPYAVLNKLQRITNKVSEFEGIMIGVGSA